MARLTGLSYKRCLVAASILLLPVFVSPSVGAETQPSPASTHALITRDALSSTLAATNLKAVMDANDSQDTPGGEGFQEKRRHFDGDNLNASVAYINREKNKAINLAAEADSDEQSRADALRHFGLMIHCMQDFYLRTNYVEMHMEEAANRETPYDLPLVDWSHLADGLPTSASGTKFTAAKLGDAADPINKENPESIAAKKIISAKVTQFSVARDLAVRETQRQWNLFETLLRERCGKRAPAVLAALRQAPPQGYANSKPSEDTPEVH